MMAALLDRPALQVLHLQVVAVLVLLVAQQPHLLVGLVAMV
jgi:hypothetical protein